MKNKKIKQICFFMILLFSVILTGCSERITGLEYTIVYDSQGGTVIPAYSGDLMNSMPIPSKDGFTFEGWYEDKDFFGKRISFPYIIQKDVILYAKYIDNNKGNEELVYNKVDNAFEVTHYNGDSYVIYIPEMHNGLPVIRLCENFINNFYSTTVLYISKNVTEIKEKLYYNKRLSTINVSGNSQSFSSQDGILYNKDRSTLVCYPSGRREKTFTIAEETTEIANYAIRNNIYLEKIIIPSGVYISDRGMYDLSKLREVKVAEDNQAFCDVNGVLFDKNKENLLFFPPNHKEKNYTVPETVKLIDEQAFYNCAIEEITLGANLERNPNFTSCKNLKSIEIAAENTLFKSVDGVLFDKTGRNLINFPSNKAADKDGSYYLPTGTKKITSFAFSEVRNIRNLYLNGEFSCFEAFAFSGENSVEKIIAESEIILQTIEGGAFSGLKKLTEFRLFCRVPPALSQGEFDNCPYELRIYVPENMRGLYEVVWSEYADKLYIIQAMTNYTVTFYTQGGSFVGNVTAGYIINEPIPEMSGYKFLGWYDNAQGTGKKYTFPMAIRENISLYAAWELL